MSSLHEFSKRRKQNEEDKNEQQENTNKDDEKDKASGKTDIEKPKEGEKNKTEADKESENSKEETDDANSENSADVIKVTKKKEIVEKKEENKTEKESQNKEPIDCGAINESSKNIKNNASDDTNTKELKKVESQPAPEISTKKSAKIIENGLNAQSTESSANDANLMNDLLKTINKTISEINNISDTESETNQVNGLAEKVAKVSVKDKPLITEENLKSISQPNANDANQDNVASDSVETSKEKKADLIDSLTVIPHNSVPSRSQTPAIKISANANQTENCSVPNQPAPSGSTSVTAGTNSSSTCTKRKAPSGQRGDRKKVSIQAGIIDNQLFVIKRTTIEPKNSSNTQETACHSNSKKASIDCEHETSQRIKVIQDQNINERASNCEVVPDVAVPANAPNIQLPCKASTSISGPSQPPTADNSRRQSETPKPNNENNPPAENSASADVFRTPMITCCRLITTTTPLVAGIERRANRPACWTEKQLQYFKKENPWLRIKNGKLGCDACIQIGRVSLRRKIGISVSQEWTTYAVTHYGPSLLQQQRSLRKKLYEHKKSMAHKMCEHILDHYKLTHRLRRLRHVARANNASNANQNNGLRPIDPSQPNIAVAPPPEVEAPPAPVVIKVENVEQTENVAETVDKVKSEHTQTTTQDQHLPQNDGENYSQENFTDQQSQTESTQVSVRDIVEVISGPSGTNAIGDQPMNIDQSSQITQISEEPSESGPTIIEDITDTDDMPRWAFCGNERTIYHSPTNTIHDQDLDRIFRTVYHLAKQNRPLTDLAYDIDLQKANGCEIHKTLEDAGEDICRHISFEMKFSVVKNIMNSNAKFSIILEENKNLSNKATLYIYLRSIFSRKCVDIFLDVIEIDNVAAEEIFSSLIACLLQYNIDMPTLESKLLAFCVDGNSTILGVDTLFPPLLYEKFPNIIIWFCLVHHLEISVSNIIEKVCGINSCQQLLEKLHDACRLNPKNYMELKEIINDLAEEISEVQNIQQLCWLASKFKTVKSIWNSFSALYNHFSHVANDPKRSAEERTLYNDLKMLISAVGFVKNLGIIYDALQELSELATEIQKHKFSPLEAHNSIIRQIKIFENMTHKQGPMSKRADAAETAEKFNEIDLQKKEEQPPEINREHFFQELAKTLRHYLPSTKPNTNTPEKNNFVTFVAELRVVQKKFWPDDVSIAYGEEELAGLCERIGVEARPVIRSFRIYKESGGRIMDDNIEQLIDILRLVPVYSGEVIRALYQSHSIKTRLHTISTRQLTDLLFIRLYGPPVRDFSPYKYVQSWPNLNEQLAKCRNEENPTTRDPTEGIHEDLLWKFF